MTRSKAMRMPGSPASPKNSAYDRPAQAASVPTEIRVSMVAAPWRRLTQAARWNGHPPQSTTGVASGSASHCQSSNCSAGIIDIASTGTDSGGRDDQPVAQRGRGIGLVGVVAGGVLGDAGRRAPYPAASTASTRPSGATRDGVEVAPSPSRWRS